MIRSRRQRGLSVVVWSSLAFSLAVLALLSYYRFFDHDEFEAVHTTWKVAQGQALYTDFIQHHHPLLYYTLSPLFSIFGSTTDVLFAARAVIFVELLAAFFVTYWLAFELFYTAARRNLIAPVSVLLLSLLTLFTDKMLEVRPDVPQSLFSLLGLLFVLRFFRLRQASQLVLAGLSFGLALLFLQKAIIFLGLVGLVLLARLLSRNVRFGDLFIFGVSVLAALLPYGLYLALNGLLPNFLFWNYAFNTVYYDLRGRQPGQLTENVLLFYRVNGPLLLLFGAGFFGFRKNRAAWEMLFLICGVLGFSLVTGRHNPQYYILAFPLVALFAARALVGFLGQKPLAATVVLLVVAFGPLLEYERGIFNNERQTRQLAQINYVLAATDPADYVYDGDIRFNLFRRDIDFVWYMTEPGRAVDTLRLMRNYDYDIYTLIERYKPKIISATAIPNLNDPRIRDHYVPVPEFEGLFVRTPSAAFKTR